MHRFVLSVGALAVAVLTACSGSAAPQAVPGAQPEARALRAGAQIHIVGAHRNKGCPYDICITVNATSGGSVELCDGSCGPVGYRWSSTFSKAKNGASYGNFVGTFYPNPGDPVIDTVTEVKPLKPSHGKYKWYQTVTVCGSGCGSSKIGIATT